MNYSCENKNQALVLIHEDSFISRGWWRHRGSRESLDKYWGIYSCQGVMSSCKENARHKLLDIYEY